MVTIKFNIKLGIKEIDTQHQRLVDIMNKLVAAIDKGLEDYVIEEIINDLVDYALTHFRTEEGYFREFKYDKTDEHISQHDEFYKKLKLFREKLNGHNKDVAQEIVAYLENWLTDHVLGHDKKYVECFHENGLY